MFLANGILVPFSGLFLVPFYAIELLPCISTPLWIVERTDSCHVSGLRTVSTTLASGRHPSILCHGISKKCTFRRLHSVCFIRVKVIFRCQYTLKIFTNFDINDLYMNPNCSEYYLHL